MGRKLIDLTGAKFGKLTVIRRDLSKNGTYWICSCECGNTKSINGVYLRSGRTKSCGCLQREWASKLGKMTGDRGPQQDLVGRKFGRLTVLSLIGKADDGRYRYLCECDCGNQVIVRNQSLLCGNSQSCGSCTHPSRGEEKIRKLLEDNGIFFERQKSFLTCKFPDSGYYAKFDFYVDNRYLIEFDGQQHFKVGTGWFTEEVVKKIKQHDNFKNQWCEDNNIPIIRIPYSRLKDLSFHDIWLPS